jgi:hypothetical protein
VAGRDIVVIGGSVRAGDAILALLEQLPATLRAAIFVAHHLPPDAEGAISNISARAGTLTVRPAVDGEPIRHGVVYVCVPDHHLIVLNGTVRLTRGPRENRWRPAIDTLFRSAAVSYESRVIGIVLTGMLDDGTAGLPRQRLQALSLPRRPCLQPGDAGELDPGQYQSALWAAIRLFRQRANLLGSQSEREGRGARSDRRCITESWLPNRSRMPGASRRSR